MFRRGGTASVAVATTFQSPVDFCGCIDCRLLYKRLNAADAQMAVDLLDDPHGLATAKIAVVGESHHVDQLAFHRWWRLSVGLSWGLGASIPNGPLRFISSPRDFQAWCGIPVNGGEVRITLASRYSRRLSRPSACTHANIATATKENRMKSA